MDLAHLISEPTIIFADNKTANGWANDDKITQGNMWILQCYHYVREMSDAGERMVAVRYVNTKWNIADLFTKGVSKEVLTQLLKYLCGYGDMRTLIKEIERQDAE